MSEKVTSGNLKSISDLALYKLELGNDDPNSYGKMDKLTMKLPKGLTNGMLFKDIIKIAWPSLIELLLTQLASMVDQMMVGGIGPWAIASVGLVMQPKMLLSTLFMSMNVGATAMVARYKGAGDHERANTILRQALMLTTLIAAVLSVVGYVFAEDLIKFMGGKGLELAVLNGSATYFKIQMIGFIPFAMTMTFTATLRGVGHSRVTMVYNTISNLVNIVFNYLLINGKFGFPRMEVAGASLATILGQFIAFILAMRQVTSGKHYLHMEIKKGFKPVKEELAKIFKIGFPALIEQGVMRVGMITYYRIVAGLGTFALATHTACMSILGFSFMLGQAVSVSSTSLVGQSLGRKRPDVAQAYSSRSSQLGLMAASILGIIILFTNDWLMALYSKEPEVIKNGAFILTIIAFLQPFQSMQFVLAGSLRGAGDTKATAVISFITVTILRPLLAWVAVYKLNMGLTGAWLALVGDQLVRSAFIYFRYREGKWKRLII